MPNVQQPEQRRNEHNPAVTDSAKEHARAAPPAATGEDRHPVPPDQQSPYGPGQPGVRDEDTDS